MIVPPNAYVIHTRRGHDHPLHIGLGVSFRFDPVTDTFLVVPGVMQTILINAHCICREACRSPSGPSASASLGWPGWRPLGSRSQPRPLYASAA